MPHVTQSAFTELLLDEVIVLMGRQCRLYVAPLTDSRGVSRFVCSAPFAAPSPKRLRTLFREFPDGGCEDGGAAPAQFRSYVLLFGGFRGSTFLSHPPMWSWP